MIVKRTISRFAMFNITTGKVTPFVMVSVCLSNLPDHDENHFRALGFDCP